MDTKLELRKNRLGISIVFLVAGLVNGIFFSNLPYLQDKLEVSYSYISMALLASTIGGFPSLFFAGYFIDKYGSKAVITITSLGYCVMLGFLFYAPSYPLLLVFLFLSGVSVGLLDVAMNSRAVHIEEEFGKSIMSSFHAFYSIAGFIAAGWTKLALVNNIPYSKFILFSCIGLVVLCLYSIINIDNKDLANKGSREKTSVITLPKGLLIGIAVLVFLAFLSEGAIGDWSAIFLNKEQGLDKSAAALGFGLFNVFMALGRTFGDHLTRRLGRLNTLRLSGAFSALLLLAVIFVPSALLSLTFIGLLGLGMANIVPILFSAAGNSGIMSPSKGIASVSMIGYFGFIIGPPLLGFIGEAIELRYAFLVIVGFSIVITLLSGLFLNKVETDSERQSVEGKKVG